MPVGASKEAAEEDATKRATQTSHSDEPLPRGASLERHFHKVLPEGCPTSPIATWSNSDVLRWLISIDETNYLELFVKRKVTGRTLLLLHLEPDSKHEDPRFLLSTFVETPNQADLLRLHSLAGHINAIKERPSPQELTSGTELAVESWKGWTTEVEFRVWSEYFMLGMERSLALAHQAVWRRHMVKFNMATTLLSALAALLGTLYLALFREEAEALQALNNSSEGINGYNPLLADSQVGSFRWYWSLAVTLISVLVTFVSGQAAKAAPKAEAAIKMVDRYSIWVSEFRVM